LFVAGVVAYAFSPIDLIPDFVPVLGYLDEPCLDSLGIAVAIRLVRRGSWPNVEPEPAKSNAKAGEPNRHGGDCRRLDSSAALCSLWAYEAFAMNTHPDARVIAGLCSPT